MGGHAGGGRGAVWNDAVEVAGELLTDKCVRASARSTNSSWVVASASDASISS